jgi:hypothetical protein
MTQMVVLYPTGEIPMSYFYSLAELSWDLIGLWHKHIASDKYGSTANVYFFNLKFEEKKKKLYFLWTTIILENFTPIFVTQP